MSEDLIERALASADDTDEVVMGDDVLGETGRLFRRLFGDAGGVVIADGNTWAVAGEQVTASLRGAGVELAEPYVFPARPSVYAEYENVELLREFLAPLDANAVVIGSGTLNDLVKKASDELGRRYLVVCTAASMDGYAAFGASISVDGFKTTLSCRAPQGLVVDLLDVALTVLVGPGRAEGGLLDGGDGPLAPQGLIAQRSGQSDHVTVDLHHRSVEATDSTHPASGDQPLLGTAPLLLLHRALPTADEPHHQEHPDEHDPEEIRRHGGFSVSTRQSRLTQTHGCHRPAVVSLGHAGQHVPDRLRVVGHK